MTLWPSYDLMQQTTESVEWALEQIYLLAISDWLATVGPALLPEFEGSSQILPPDPDAITRPESLASWDEQVRDIVLPGVAMIWSYAFAQTAYVFGADMGADTRPAITADGSPDDDDRPPWEIPGQPGYMEPVAPEEIEVGKRALAEQRRKDALKVQWTVDPATGSPVPIGTPDNPYGLSDIWLHETRTPEERERRAAQVEHDILHPRPVVRGVDTHSANWTPDFPTWSQHVREMQTHFRDYAAKNGDGPIFGEMPQEVPEGRFPSVLWVQPGIAPQTPQNTLTQSRTSRKWVEDNWPMPVENLTRRQMSKRDLVGRMVALAWNTSPEQVKQTALMVWDQASNKRRLEMFIGSYGVSSSIPGRVRDLLVGSTNENSRRAIPMGEFRDELGMWLKSAISTTSSVLVKGEKFMPNWRKGDPHVARVAWTTEADAIAGRALRKADTDVYEPGPARPAVDMWERHRALARENGLQAAGIINQAMLSAASASGVEFDKVWCAHMDRRTRNTHYVADGQRISIDGDFTVGGAKLDYPGDPSGPSQETRNCRCRVGMTDIGEPLPPEQRRNSAQKNEIIHRSRQGLIRAREDPEGIGVVPTGSIIEEDQLPAPARATAGEATAVPAKDKPRGPIKWTGPSIAPPLEHEVLMRNTDFDWSWSGFDANKVPMRRGAREAMAEGYEGLSAEIRPSDPVGKIRTLSSLEGYMADQEGVQRDPFLPSPKRLAMDAERALEIEGKELVARAIASPPTETILWRGAKLPPKMVESITSANQISLPLSSFTSKEDLARAFGGDDRHAWRIDWESSDIPDNAQGIVYRLEPGAKVAPLGPIGGSTENALDERVGFGQFKVVDVSPPSEVEYPTHYLVPLDMDSVQAEGAIRVDHDPTSNVWSVIRKGSAPVVVTLRQVSMIERAVEDAQGRKLDGQFALAAGRGQKENEVNSDGKFRTFTDAVIAYIGTPTSDGRMLRTDIALTFRTFPLPLMWMKQGAEGHSSAYTVGVIETAEQRGDTVVASGYLLNTAEADEAADQLAHGVTRPSVDLAAATWVATDRDGKEVTEEDPDAEVFVTITEAELIGTTLVATPAFGDTSLPLNLGRESRDVELVAAAADEFRPRVYDHRLFENPNLTGPTLPTMGDDGRVYGHLACFGECHRSIQTECVIAPRSRSDYAHFHTSPALRLDDGSRLPVGRLTVGTGHAHSGATPRAAAAHYDNTGTCFALVRVGEDSHGIWFSGVAAPWATQAQIEQGLSSPLSGDWRDFGQGLELVAALAVNTPGFSARGRSDEQGRPIALVASLGPTEDDVVEPTRDITADTIKAAVKEALGEAQLADIAARIATETAELLDRASQITRPPTPSEEIAEMLAGR